MRPMAASESLTIHGFVSCHFATVGLARLPTTSPGRRELAGLAVPFYRDEKAPGTSKDGGRSLGHQGFGGAGVAGTHSIF